jgi:hypothetical protein
MIWLYGLIMMFVNRFCGGGFGWNYLSKDNGGILPGRPIYYLTPFLLAGTWCFGMVYFMCAISFILWRSIPQYGTIDMGTDEGSKFRDIVVMSFKNLTIFPVFLYLEIMFIPLTNFGFETPAIISMLLMNISLTLFYVISWMIPFKDKVASAEIGCGFLWGIYIYNIVESANRYASIS